jgi:hypothetical protein
MSNISNIAGCLIRNKRDDSPLFAALLPAMMEALHGTKNRFLLKDLAHLCGILVKSSTPYKEFFQEVCRLLAEKISRNEPGLSLTSDFAAKDLCMIARAMCIEGIYDKTILAACFAAQEVGRIEQKTMQRLVQIHSVCEGIDGSIKKLIPPRLHDAIMSCKGIKERHQSSRSHKEIEHRIRVLNGNTGEHHRFSEKLTIKNEVCINGVSVDTFIPTANLAIEVNGDTHYDRSGRLNKKSLFKTKVLKSYGLQVANLDLREYSAKDPAGQDQQLLTIIEGALAHWNGSLSRHSSRGK